MLGRVLALAVLLLAVAPSPAADAPKPVVAGPEGQRAFDELAFYYKDTKKEPGFKQSLTDLSSPHSQAAKSAGAYVTALFKQLFEDESNGRAPWKRTPFFGGGSTNDARDYRKKIAATFGKEAQGEAALDAALWLLEGEKLAPNQSAGMEALKRIKAPRSAEIFQKLLAQPHPNAEVAKGVIEEVGARRMKELAPEIRRLCGHYRASVREAARSAATAVGVTPIPEYKPEDAFTPWLDAQLKSIAAMVTTVIPKDAAWTRFTVTTHEANEATKKLESSGWNLGEKDGEVKALDCFGAEVAFKKKDTALAPRTWAGESQELLDVRKSGKLETLSRRGGLTQQFEPKFLTLPEALVGAWCYGRGDKKTAAALLFPLVDGMADDRWLLWVARDLLGHYYHQQMLDAFSGERDYPKTIALAKHLAAPHFDEFTYQPRCAQLAAQLEKRQDDFKTFVLPKSAEWEALKKQKSRKEQIEFLAQHIRLMNCIQLGQPGDVNYEDNQYEKPGTLAGGKSAILINPYKELQGLKLDLVDLPVLVPFLADENFLPTYSYWRDFHTKRTIHQANWLVAALVDETAKKQLSDLGTYSSLDDAGKKGHLEKILAWCAANKDKTRDQLPDERPKRQSGGPRIDAP